MVYSTTLLEQRFEFANVLPFPSYVGDFWDAYNAYTGGTGTSPFAIFRGVNQSDPAMQVQMSDYLHQLSACTRFGTHQHSFGWITFTNSRHPIRPFLPSLLLPLFLLDKLMIYGF
mmetsp:Transcript_23584/g.57813  ORF Transcript_23584/g.57813 Transcript_23584/m.57813 type:complete len:115 (-) Transcript_23584:1617-1961(-)